KIRIAGVRQATTLRPVADGFQINIDESANLGAPIAKGDGLFDEGEELQLVLNVFGCEQTAVGQAPHVFRSVNNLQLTVAIQIAGITGVIPAVRRKGFDRSLRILVVLLEQAGAFDLNLAIFRDTDFHTRDGRPDSIGAHLAVELNTDKY